MSLAQPPAAIAHQAVGSEQIQAWVNQFHRDGYLFLPGVLPAGTTAALRDDLDRVLDREPVAGGGIELHPRMLETSPTNVSLFNMEPIVTFAEALVEQNCHVIHNNSFRTPTGGSGLSSWHQDDASHYVVTHGERPTNVHLPVLLFTANYYLTDVDTVAHGPTEVIPGSHLYGGSPPQSLDGTPHQRAIVSCVGPAGSVVMFNNQVWHRGGPNTSDRVRYMTQVSYARRIIGHKYAPFMNYQMPEHVFSGADDRLRRLLGFLPSGAYG